MQDERRSRAGGDSRDSDSDRDGDGDSDGDGVEGGGGRRGGSAADDFRAHLVGPRRRHFAKTLEAAAARGDLRPGVDHEAVFELLVGSVFLRVTSGKAVDDPGYEDQLVDLLYHAVARTTAT
nr:hypothetical protein GCM10020093_107420 [Planobispora longispora]